MPIFVDTNVLVYARDATEPDKQRRAKEWMDALWERHSGRLSIQVLNEYYVVVTEKLAPGLSTEAARADVRDLMSWRPLALETSLVEEAWSAHDRYAVSFWDSLVVAAASRLSCEYLLSEDFQHGSEFGRTRVVDPFLHHPSDLATN